MEVVTAPEMTWVHFADKMKNCEGFSLSQFVKKAHELRRIDLAGLSELQVVTIWRATEALELIYAQSEPNSIAENAFGYYSALLLVLEEHFQARPPDRFCDTWHELITRFVNP